MLVMCNCVLNINLHICASFIIMQDQHLEGWLLQVQINSKRNIMYTFNKSFKISPGKTLTVSLYFSVYIVDVILCISLNGNL